VSEFEVHPGPGVKPASPPAGEFPAAVLDAAEAAVRERPGITSADLEHVIPGKMLASGHPAVIMSRDRAKAIMRVLEGQGRIERRTGQARVGFYPAREETSDA
jgi:hypothetical protein